jgi:hypothetical protein
MTHLTVSQVARQFGIRPRVISDLFYSRILDDTRCPIAGRVRLVPSNYLPRVKRVLSERGLIRDAESVPA